MTVGRDNPIVFIVAIVSGRKSGKKIGVAVALTAFVCDFRDVIFGERELPSIDASVVESFLVEAAERTVVGFDFDRSAPDVLFHLLDAPDHSETFAFRCRISFLSRAEFLRHIFDHFHSIRCALA